MPKRKDNEVSEQEVETPTSEDITPTSAHHVEDGQVEYFFPRQQKTIRASSLAEAQELLAKELAKDESK